MFSHRTITMLNLLNKNNDKNIIDFIKKYKESNKKMSKRNLKYAQKDINEAEDVLGKFGIKDDELENIFDIIAKSNPEL